MMPETTLPEIRKYLRGGKAKGQRAMIQLEKQDGVGIMTMGYRSENRFHPDFVRAMTDGLDEAEKDPEIRAIVVTGGDPKFFSN